MKRPTATLAFFSVLFPLAASGDKEPFQPTVDFVDLERFSGPWYVIALMPTPFEKNAVNGIETYSIRPKGTITIEYTFSKNSPDGKPVTMHQKGWIMDTNTDAEWKIQPLWPIRLPYLVIDPAENYRYTVIGTNNFNYLWIMAREPEVSKEDFEGVLHRLEARGYDISQIRLMPQEW